MDLDQETLVPQGLLEGDPERVESVEVAGYETGRRSGASEYETTDPSRYRDKGVKTSQKFWPEH